MKPKWTVPAALVLSAVLVGFSFVYRAGTETADVGTRFSVPVRAGMLPVDFDSLERELLADGVIDPEKWNGSVRTELNLLWAFGLASKNSILTEGPMMDPRYGGAGNFASTGGWTLAKNEAMDHYAMHEYVALTGPQQELVERVAKNVYRPCCGNPVYFPDCNHGMAMLGLLEIMAANGASEGELYRAALVVNREWFPDTYETIDRYLTMKRMPSAEEDPKTALSYDLSSAEGYQRVLSEVEPVPAQGGGSCGV